MSVAVELRDLNETIEFAIPMRGNESRDGVLEFPGTTCLQSP